VSFDAMRWTWTVRDLSPSARLVLLCLANYANERGECWPSHATIVRMTGLARSTVKKWLKELEQARVMQRTPGHNTETTVYRLPVPGAGQVGRPGDGLGSPGAGQVGRPGDGLGRETA